MTSLGLKYGPWAVVAGGSDGIGAAISRQIALAGVNLLIIGRSETKLSEIARSLQGEAPGIEVRTFSADLSLPSSADRVAKFAADLEVGLLVYNVGSETKFGDFLDQEPDWVVDRMLRNQVTKASLTHHFGRKMRVRQRGGVILVGSMSGFWGGAGFALYCGSKAFTRYFAEGIWHEFKKDGIDVLCPVVGAVNTPSIVNAYGGVKGGGADPDKVAESMLAHLGQGPIWISDEILERVTYMDGLAPAERAIVAAETGARFAIRNAAA